MTFNKNFYDVFTKEELDELVSLSVAYGENCICISQNDSFIELSADTSDKLEISYSQGKNSQILTKEELLKICKDLPNIKGIRLKDVAEVVSPESQSFIPKTTDIIMCVVGKDIGKLTTLRENEKKGFAKSHIIIRSEDKSLLNTLNSKKDEIKSLAKGKAIPRVYKKDLLELSI